MASFPFTVEVRGFVAYRDVIADAHAAIENLRAQLADRDREIEGLREQLGKLAVTVNGSDVTIAAPVIGYLVINGGSVHA